MHAAIRREFTLKGLCCPNCAAQIEKEIAALDGIQSASVDMVAESMSLELDNEDCLESLVNTANGIIKRHEQEAVLIAKEPARPGKKTVGLTGLCCAECARELEEELRRIEGVRFAAVDFIGQKLEIEAEDERMLPGIIRKAAALAKSIDADAEIQYREKEAEHSEEKKGGEMRERILLIAGALLFVVAFFVKSPRILILGLFMASYLLVGFEVLFRAARNITHGRVFDENFLMTLATIGAFAIGKYPEGVAVMLFYQVGELFQRLAVNRSRKSIAALMDIRPDYANLKEGDTVRRVAPEEVGVGERILVKPGEKIPLDGRIVEGASMLDTSALTGESLPIEAGPGCEVLSGSINLSGVLVVEVTKAFGDSTVSKILSLVQNASSKKAPTENFITKFARVYTPAVVFAAAALALIPPLVLPGAAFRDCLSRALVFLVISCPCALVISIPLSFFGGIGGASRKGILIKGSNYLEALNSVDTFVFDKTGTLTKGVFRVAEIQSAGAFSQEELLRIAAHAEGYSSHPIAVSIQKAFGREIDKERITDLKEIPGQGIAVNIDGKAVLAGNAKLMESEGIPCLQPLEPGTIVYLAVDNRYAGFIRIADEIKEDSRTAVAGLRRAGVSRLVMLTGDNRSAADRVAADLGLDETYAELLPQQKVSKFELLKQRQGAKRKLAFVGDGINDAPVLAMADVGIAMGGVGSDAAIEAADVVLMTDEPSKLPLAIRIARKTHRIVMENIFFALGVKAVLLVLGAFGIASMWAAVFGDVGVTVIAILNAMRALRVKSGRAGEASVFPETDAD